MRKRTKIERLSRKSEKDTIKRIVYLLAISVILVIFLFTFGISILGRMADFLELVFQGGNTDEGGAQVELRAPTLDRLPNATNSAELEVSGFASNDASVYVFLDGDKIGEAKVENNKFIYQSVQLSRGDNRISVKLAKDGGESGFSSEFNIIFDDTDPNLEITSPNQNQNFQGDNRISVKGKTEVNAQVYANGFLATVGSDGEFEIFVPVEEGESEIEIVAIDEAGNSSTEVRTIVFRK